LLTFLLVFMTAAVITSVIPEKYESTSVVQVHPSTIAITPFRGQSSVNPGSQMTAQYLQNEFETIIAPETLKQAAEMAQLPAQWEMEMDVVVNILKGIVETTPRRGTDFIEINVRHASASDAKDIAESVAEAYILRRKKTEEDRAKKALKALDNEKRELSDLVQDYRKDLTVLIQQYGIPYFDDGGSGNHLGLTEQAMFRSSREELAKLENEGDLLRAKYEALERDKIEQAKLTPQLEVLERQVLKMREMVDARQKDAITLSLKQTNYTQAKEQYEQSRGMLREMKFKHSEAKILLKMPRDPITLHETPKKAKKPVFPNFTMNLLLGAGVGLIFGIAIALLLEHLDTSVKSLEDVERYLQVPVLAVIPKDVGVLHKQSGMSPDAEAYRILRTNIEFNRKNPDNNSITVVSGGAGEGKSTTLVNLAYVCAQGGYTTLMIDADLRRPRLHTFFDINNSVGLTNYLTTDLALEDVILQTPVDNLYFMPSGILPADAAGILNSRRMSELLQDVKQRFDLVLVDSPPILGVSDAAVLASEVDLTMVVVQHRKLPRNMLMRVKQAVENVGGQVIGVVLNNVDVRSDSQYQYYTSYYTYYAPSNMEENQKPQAMTAHQSSKSEPKSYSSSDTSNDDLY